MPIRLYQPADRDAVHRIAADTAFFGQPVEAFLPDRQFFSDAFTAYYTDEEPEHLWVADVEGHVAGYFAGSLAGSRLEAGRHALLRVARGLAGGRYHGLSEAVRYGLRLVGASLRGEYPSPSLQEYPAHLHINLDGAYRGRGLGRQLMDAGLAGLATAGSPGVHLNTTSYNAAAVAMYEKMGFILLGSHPTKLWEPWLPDVAIENRVYGKSLRPG
jgi:ribosomal protein S18 acetylase RimI-like enzyme